MIPFYQVGKYLKFIIEPHQMPLPKTHWIWIITLKSTGMGEGSGEKSSIDEKYRLASPCLASSLSFCRVWHIGKCFNMLLLTVLEDSNLTF